MIKDLESLPNGKQIIEEIYSNEKQTGKLIGKYKETFNNSLIEILDQVSLLTSENIHLNTFMFEPILDMSLLHLYDLYHKIKQYGLE